MPSQTAQEVGNPWHPCLVHLMTFMQHIISMIALVHAIKEFIIAAFHAEVEIVVARILELSHLLYRLVFEIVHTGVAADGFHPRKIMINHVGDFQQVLGLANEGISPLQINAVKSPARMSQFFNVSFYFLHGRQGKGTFLVKGTEFTTPMTAA